LNKCKIQQWDLIEENYCESLENIGEWLEAECLSKLTCADFDFAISFNIVGKLCVEEFPVKHIQEEDEKEQRNSDWKFMMQNPLKAHL
jgi:hypothetical protein